MIFIAFSLTFLQTNLGELRTFQNLLDNNPDTFHASRTAKGLQYHWALMRHTCLLCDQEGSTAFS